METLQTDDSKHFASIIHEIKRPVSAMSMLANLMLEDMQEPATKKRDEQMQKNLREIVKQGQRCSRIIENMQRSSKDSSQASEPVDINAIIKQIINELPYQINKEGITVCTGLEDDLPEIKGDREAIRRLLLNLITNAVDAMTHSSKKILSISSRTLSQGINIEVMDTGCGIKPEDQKRIFNSFYTTKGNKGMGLGLSISKSVVENHNGSITVTSRENTGTQIHVFLPLTSYSPMDGEN